MIKKKIKDLNELKKIIATLKAKGKRIVFTNGCFDLLHYGHVKYLEETKQKGDILVVAVNSDASVKRIKGDKKPIVKEEDRLGVIAALESVDYVVKFNEDTPLETIKILRPDILVKGSDWLKNRIVGSDFVQGYGGKVLAVQLVSGRSTTDLIRKIVKVFAKK